MAYALEVDYKNHIVLLWEAGYEFNHDLGFTVLLKSSSLVGDVELILLVASAVSWHSNNIVDFNIRGVSEMYGFLYGELIGYASEVYDLL